jgi:hypothetical protein
MVRLCIPMGLCVSESDASQPEEVGFCGVSCIDGWLSLDATGLTNYLNRSATLNVTG